MGGTKHSITHFNSPYASGVKHLIVPGIPRVNSEQEKYYAKILCRIINGPCVAPFEGKFYSVRVFYFWSNCLVCWIEMVCEQSKSVYSTIVLSNSISSTNTLLCYINKQMICQPIFILTQPFLRPTLTPVNPILISQTNSKLTLTLANNSNSIRVLVQINFNNSSHRLCQYFKIMISFF